MSMQQPNNVPPVTQPEVDVTPADVTQVTTETPAVVETSSSRWSNTRTASTTR